MSTIRHRDGTIEVLPVIGDPIADVWCALDDKPSFATVNGVAFCHDDILNGLGRRFALLSLVGQRNMALSWAIRNGGAA